MAIFPYSPDWGCKPTMQPRILKAQFGDGYDQRAGDGLNTRLPIWPLTFSVRTQTEATAIAAWLAAKQADVTPFSWAVPGDSSVTAHGFGVGDGTTTAFQLQRTQLSTMQPNQWDPTLYPMVTTPRTNIVLRSQAFQSSPWSNAAGTPLVDDNSTMAPDGTATAGTFVAGVVGNSSYRRQLINYPGGQWTNSCWIKKNNYGYVFVRLGTIGISGGKVPFLNLDTGIVTNNVAGVTLTATAYPNGWWRLQATGVMASGTQVFDVGMCDSTGNQAWISTGVESFYYFQAQSEAGATATPAIPTTTAAVTVNPAYYPAIGDGFGPITDINPQTPLQIYRTDWQGNQLLSQIARTNLALYSEQFDNAAWAAVATGVTITANNATSPRRDTTADTATFAATTSYRYQAISTGSLMGRTFTFSAWLSAPSGKATIGLRMTSPSGGSNATVVSINLTTTPVRVSITKTFATTDVALQFGLDNQASFGGDGIAGDVVVWGFQLEENPLLTSYIPTTTAAVTVTDYTLSSTGLVTFATAPVTGAALTWTGAYTRKYVANKWTPATPDDYGSWSVQAEFRMVPA